MAPTVQSDSRLNLENLRRSVAWTGVPTQTNRRAHDTLSQRLETLLILELHQDGGRQYLSLSIRGLYKHVLSAITTAKKPVKPNKDSDQADEGVAITTPEDKEDCPPPLPARRPTSVGFQESSSVGKRRRIRHSRVLSSSDHVTYRERLGGHIHPRDFRKLVIPFSTTNQPDLIVRRHVMLLNFDPLRAIVLRDRLLVLVPNGADSMLAHLEKSIRSGHEEQHQWVLMQGSSTKDIANSNKSEHNKSSGKLVKGLKRMLPKKSLSASTPLTPPENLDTASLASDSDKDESDDEYMHEDVLGALEEEWDELQHHDWADLPFELQCTDTVLHVVGSMLTDDTMELQEASAEYIQRLLQPSGLSDDDPLTIIRAIKDAVREMTSRVNGFLKSLNRILDEDEDMALMNLSRLLTHPDRFVHPVSAEVLEEESDEPELILEAHLQTALTLTNSLDLIQGQIDTAAELVDQKLDAVRNRLLYANMLISILSLCVACASLVGSFFGMNLKNNWENDGNAFGQVTFGTIAGSVALAFMIVFVLTFSGTIPSSGFRAEV